MVESFRLVLDIFKISPAHRAGQHHQTGQFMPVRVHPTTLDTITDAWGQQQLDVYGLFMYIRSASERI